MLKIREIIIVEGRYDKNAVSQVADAVIIETSGFGIFNDAEKRQLLQRLARERGVIIFTDSDGAGFVIRNFLKGCIPPQYIKNAYIPDIYGKEKRKSSPSKEGKLGVEGMRPEVIESALRKAGATIEGEEELSSRSELTKADMYALGLCGGRDSAEKRRRLQERLGLPRRLTANGLLEALNILSSKEEIQQLISGGL